METKLFPVLVDMRFLGVRVDVDRAAIEKQRWLKKKKILGGVHSETGLEVQIWAARSIAKVFDKLKLPYDRTQKTGAPSLQKTF